MKREQIDRKSISHSKSSYQEDPVSADELRRNRGEIDRRHDILDEECSEILRIIERDLAECALKHP